MRQAARVEAAWVLSWPQVRQVLLALGRGLPTVELGPQSALALALRIVRRIPARRLLMGAP